MLYCESPIPFLSNAKNWNPRDGGRAEGTTTSGGANSLALQNASPQKEREDRKDLPGAFPMGAEKRTGVK